MPARTLPSQQYLHECFRYDDELGALFWLERPAEHFRDGLKHTAEDIAKRWNARLAGARFGWIQQCRANVYRAGEIDHKFHSEHRLIWKLLTGGSPPVVDHRDENGLNNRFSNLRAATVTQARASSRGKLGRTLPKGVTEPKRGRFAAQIWVGGKIPLGTFDTAAEAHAAYCKAAVRFYGEFATEAANRDRYGRRFAVTAAAVKKGGRL